MIEQTNPPITAQPLQTQKVLRMVKNERMGGSVPVWETVKMTPQASVEQTLSQAQNGGAQSGLAATGSFETALAYQQIEGQPTQNDDSFGFADLVDMVNPLQHIPLVGHAYRSITGDEIKPIGQIIGGAVFGGAIGAAAGLTNVIIQEETGKDMTGNAYSMLVDGEMPQFKQASNNPEKALSEAKNIAEKPDDLPAALLAFTPPAYETGFRAEKANVKAADGRTAGSFSRIIAAQTQDSPVIMPGAIAREPITQIDITPMPDRNDLY